MALLPDPALLLAAAGALTLFVRGWRARPAHGPAARNVGEPWRFATGIIVVLVALAPALDGLAGRSFAWHMVQHQLLVLAAAPLLVSTRPLRTARWAVRRHAGQAATDLDRLRPGWLARAIGWVAVAAAMLHLGTVLAWHLPPLYDAAMADPRLHHLEHLTLLGSALLAWGTILTAARDRGARALAAVTGLAANALAGAGLGVVLLSAPVPLYGWYAELGAVALEQQRVGGALMKVSAVMVHAGAAVWIVTRWLHRLSAEPDDGRPSAAVVVPPAPGPSPREHDVDQPVAPVASESSSRRP
jgi:putative membrane protein